MVPSRQMKLGLGQVSSQRYGPKLRPSYAYYFEWSGIERMGKFELEHSLQNLPTAKWEWKVAPVWRSSMNEDLRASNETCFWKWCHAAVLTRSQ